MHFEKEVPFPYYPDEYICHILNRLNGSNAENEWAREGRRIIPLLRRATPLTAFTPAADAVKREVETENEERFVKNPAKTKTQKKKSLSEEQLRGLMPPPPPPLKASPTTSPNSKMSFVL